MTSATKIMGYLPLCVTSIQFHLLLYFFPGKEFRCASPEFPSSSQLVFVPQFPICKTVVPLACDPLGLQ